MAITLSAATSLLKKPIEDLYSFSKNKILFKIDGANNEKNAKKIAQKVLMYDKVRTIWQKSKDVKISDMYYPPKIKFSENVEIIVESLKSLSRHENFVIEGTVGQGKSIFLRYLCLQELGENSTSRIPIFIELRTLEKYETLENAIKNNLENLGFLVNDELYESYLESGKIVLLLDAFDELPSKCINSVMEELEAFSVRYSELQIIVTSRPGRDIQKTVRFNILQICPLQPKDFEPFFKKISVPAILLTNLISILLSEGNKVATLLTTPLMLTLAAFVYRAERDIPKELPQFFEILFQTVFTAHDKTKIAFTRECKSGLDDASLQRLFEAFCFMALKEGRLRSLKNDLFERAYSEAQKYSKASCKLSDFKHDIVQVACLMQIEGYDTTFIHQSIQEYYSASFIKNCISDVAEKFYSFAKNDPRDDGKWIQVLNFLKHIDEYRWAKYYRLPLINEAIDQLKKFDDPVLDFLIGDSEIYFEKNKNDQYSFKAFTGFFIENKIISDLSDQIRYNIISTFDQNKKFISTVINSSAHVPQEKLYKGKIDEKVIYAKLLLSETSDISRNLRELLDSKKKKLEQERDLLTVKVNLEESKVDIF